MRKDYISGQSSDGVDENKFIEDHWTKIWNSQKNTDKFIKQIENMDEFKTMNPFMKNLAPGSFVLDGGCGMGEWVRYWDSRGFKTTGLDMSELTIERLRKQFPNQNFVAGDIRKTEFPDNHFDAYYSWGTFEHFENGFKECFTEAHRILKPGGLLFVTVPFDNIRHSLGSHLQAKLANGSDAGLSKSHRFYQWRLTKSELIREFTINQFRVQHTEPIHLREGVNRWVQQRIKVNPEQGAGRYISYGIRKIAPKNLLSHMIMCVGMKI